MGAMVSEFRVFDDEEECENHVFLYFIPRVSNFWAAVTFSQDLHLDVIR